MWSPLQPPPLPPTTTTTVYRIYCKAISFITLKHVKSWWNNVNWIPLMSTTSHCHGALWDIGQVHCGICEIGLLLYIVIHQNNFNCPSSFAPIPLSLTNHHVIDILAPDWSPYYRLVLVWCQVLQNNIYNYVESNSDVWRCITVLML